MNSERPNWLHYIVIGKQTIVIAIFYKSETFTKFQNFILNSKDSKKIGGTQALAAE